MLLESLLVGRRPLKGHFWLPRCVFLDDVVVLRLILQLLIAFGNELRLVT